MKKIYTTPEFKRKHKKKVKRREKKKRNRKRNRTRNSHTASTNNVLRPTYKNEIKEAIVAPNDLRLLENTEECLKFFSALRNKENQSIFRNIKYVEMSFHNIEQIDYSSISILTAINDDFKSKNIILRGNFPLADSPKKYLLDSGFLNNMFDEKGRPYPKTEQSEMLFFEKGSQKLSLNENRRISEIVQNIVNHLCGVKTHYPPLRTLFLEIFANSIEWSETKHKQWLLGIKYEQNRVIITVTDVGKGIIKTLYKKLEKHLMDIIQLKSNDQILIGAFNKKYGSHSKQANRNKGLPFIKAKFDDHTIDELKVITNNVILHFDDKDKTRTIKSSFPWFKGTFYRWVVTKNNIKINMNGN